MGERTASNRRVRPISGSLMLLALALIPTVGLPQTQGDAIVAGREKYVQCASCHGADGRSTVMGKYPKIGGQNSEYVESALKSYRDGRRQGSYAALMVAVAKQLSDQDIANLATYIQSLGP
jgi:cytochrome c553